MWTVGKGLFGVLICAGVAAVIITGTLGMFLYRHAHPQRAASVETPAELFTRFDDVRFRSSDGIIITGWWIPGREGNPILILCHDLGESKASLLGLAARLAEQQYSILLFDFRGHGGSGGTSSFGTLEKRDLIGAIDWAAARPGTDGSHIGVIGIGMGAYAGILAAAERPQVRCLALDSPYPEASTEFAAAELPQGMTRGFVARCSRLVYDLAYRVRSSKENAGLMVRGLSDRNLLFIAPKDLAPAAEAAQGMYESVSENRNNFKNLQILPATGTTSMYGKDRDRYDEEMLGFFRSYLPAAPRIAAAIPARAHKPVRR
jgi:pimeloyl-ACP methyl ester carboxylesterase